MADAAAPATRKLAADDDHVYGGITSTPITLLLGLVVFGAAFYQFSMLQITATEQAVFGLLMINVHLNPGTTAQQAVDLMNNATDRNQTIANAIGWGVQLALFGLAFSSARASMLVHQKYGGAKSPSLARSALTRAKWEKIMLVFLIGSDVLTDFLYVISGHSLTNGTILWFIPSMPASAWGVLLVGLVYPAAICFVTVFCGTRCVHNLEALLDILLHRKLSVAK